MDKTAIFLLILGLILLLVSGKYLVESSVTLARHFRIPTSIIGLTIVAFGTSAPELLVSIQAAVQGHPDMAVGNVIGSNISNILLVLGLTTIIFPLLVQRESIVRDWPIMMGVSLVLLLFLPDNQITRPEALIMLLLMGGYILFSVRQSRLPRYADPLEVTVIRRAKWWVAAIIFLVACAGLAFGASLLVDNAAAMAGHFGISERVISITMVALGTSLPELSTSLIAAFKKETDISIGNILGSNIMNIISVLGITAFIKPITTVPEVLHIDMPWMLGSAVLLFLFMIPARQGRINRIEGSIMVLCYAAYIYFIFIT
ncbi:MAG: calcium/sodium antiporter [Bacteroidales bacterium]|nr:calcium/sodium antiporter [Bacteroidales bacterium]MDT8430619.1 calcium/sodium antiporter [Bacteroidales bacterium]